MDEDVEEPPVGSLEPFSKRSVTIKKDVTISIPDSQQSSSGDGRNETSVIATQPVLGFKAAPSGGLSLRLS